MNKNKKTAFTITTGFMCLLGLFSNCTQSGFRSLTSELGITVLDTDITSVADSEPKRPHAYGDEYVPNGGRVAIGNYNQILASMLSVTGLGVYPMPIGNENSPVTVARDTMDMYKNMFSTEGEVERITAPMLLAYVSISNSVCQGMVRVEIERAAADRIFFAGIEVTPNANPNSTLTTAKVTPVIRKMARAFWGRNETDAERKFITDSLSEMNVESVASSGEPNRSSMIWLCSSMLASVSSIAN